MVLDTIKQAGSAWKAARLAEQFEKTLTEEQHELVAQLKSLAGGMAADLLPDEMQPVVNYVLTDSNDPLIARLVGAALHPTTKQSLAGLLPQPNLERTLPDEGIAIKCRACNHTAMYGGILESK